MCLTVSCCRCRSAERLSPPEYGARQRCKSTARRLMDTLLLLSFVIISMKWQDVAEQCWWVVRVVLTSSNFLVILLTGTATGRVCATRKIVLRLAPFSSDECACLQAVLENENYRSMTVHRCHLSHSFFSSGRPEKIKIDGINHEDGFRKHVSC